MAKAQKIIEVTGKCARPLLSSDFVQCRRRVLGLYKAWSRYVPYIVKYYDIPKNELECRCKLREYFYKHACLTDIRIIDLLVLKGYMELKEVTHQWQQKGRIMSHWNPSIEPKPVSFIGKFLAGL